jgi:glycosyltransferase involved in cell wall biosynthesis
MQPLLSVVIPTHHRSHYAYYAIRSILSIRDNRIEVVVSDTSGDDKLFTMLSLEGELLISDPRLKLIRPMEKLDMTGNHNAAIAAATGEYVCLIGDDDTITQDALAATAWAKLNGIEIIAPDVVSNYAWPDFLSLHFGSKHSSRLYVPKKIEGVVWHTSKEALNGALKNAAQGTDGLPKIYHGIVKRSLLEKIKDLAGNYFYGSSPDVSGAIGLVLCSENFVSVKYPLTIPGASGGSNTGRSAMNKHKGKLSSESQTKSFENEGWSKGVPKFFSVETVWAHAALETIKRISPDKIIDYNYVRLFASCIILHPEYHLEIEQAIADASLIIGIQISEMNSRIKAESFKLRLKRFGYICRRLLHPTASGGRLFIPGLETIEEAPEALKKHMNENGWSWENIIH